MNAKRAGLWGGLSVFLGMLIVGPPAGIEPAAWQVAALTLLMAIWWMTEALPLTVTALNVTAVKLTIAIAIHHLVTFPNLFCIELLHAWIGCKFFQGY